MQIAQHRKISWLWELKHNSYNSLEMYTNFYSFTFRNLPKQRELCCDLQQHPQRERTHANMGAEKFICMILKIDLELSLHGGEVAIKNTIFKGELNVYILILSRKNCDLKHTIIHGIPKLVMLVSNIPQTKKIPLCTAATITTWKSGH